MDKFMADGFGLSPGLPSVGGSQGIAHVQGRALEEGLSHTRLPLPVLQVTSVQKTSHKINKFERNYSLSALATRDGGSFAFVVSPVTGARRGGRAEVW